jgi:hypothetical protein
MTRKNVGNTYTDKASKFALGNPGRPKGARHNVTRAVEALLEARSVHPPLAREAVLRPIYGT